MQLSFEADYLEVCIYMPPIIFYKKPALKTKKSFHSDYKLR